MGTPKIVVIGAGVGGLTAAMLLAARGADVTVLEREGAAGGKMRPVRVGGKMLDAGPTVFTMRWVFEEIFAEAGALLTDRLALTPAKTLARHAWGPDETLDLFADIDESADAIGVFAGAAEARGYRAFCARSQRIFKTLEKPFLRAERPTPGSLLRKTGFADLLNISAFSTMWRALGEHFADPRLRQLFGRYATYCGSSPFQAPATLMLVAHVEQAGVWLVEGGMACVAAALEAVAQEHGARFRYGEAVAKISVQSGRAAGVELESGERIAADAVVFNGDAAALAAGFLGREVAGGSPPVAPAERSLSAVTWGVVAHTEGFRLARHTVFFSADYSSEFQDLKQGVLPGSPSIYVCAQDRGDAGGMPAGAERLLCLINAPANGDSKTLSATEISQCEDQVFARLARSGLIVHRAAAAISVTTPAAFAKLYPATGGALYGQAVHGPMASFRRPGVRAKLPGLYLAGGSTHPGAGVPMAALSGRMAANCLLEDWVSTGTSRKVAMRGGMSMR